MPLWFNASGCRRGWRPHARRGGVVMFVAILFRIPLHTGRTGHQMGHHPHIYPA
jgi:hypothetical protein